MKSSATKIVLILLGLSIFSCNPVKRVGDNEHLLTKNKIYADSSKISTSGIYDQLALQPNQSLPLIKYPLRLHIYNAARSDPDSLFYNWLYRKPNREKHLTNLLSKKQVEQLGRDYVNWQKFKKNVGEAPVIIDTSKIRKSAKRLQAWYWNHGWFNAESDYKIKPKSNKRAKVNYYVTKHQPYEIDSLTSTIKGKAADSIYDENKEFSPLRKGDRFNTKKFDAERGRLTSLFRNNGLYHFEQENIAFNVDTINTNHKANVETVVGQHQVKKGDSTYREPFKKHYISEVNVFTNYARDEKRLPITDSLHYNGYRLFSHNKSKYHPKALTEAIFIKKGDLYKDKNRTLTYDRINDLGIFEYPDIQYTDDPRDSTDTDLIANVFLKSRKKFGLTFDFDVSRSNIQDFGLKLGGSLQIRNIFHGLETLEISARASIANSSDASISRQNRFFNINEIGADVKLKFPKIIFPFNINRIIPKTMSPYTTFSTGISTQHNIGLDKQNLTGKYTFEWEPSQEFTNRFNLIDLQYVRNLNSDNYFNVYRNSYERLNQIARDHVERLDPADFEQDNPVLSPAPDLRNPEGANDFMDDIQGGRDFDFDEDEAEEAQTLAERKERLTENNLIFGSSFNFSKNTRQNIYDDQFTQFRFNIEAVGNSLALLASAFNFEKSKNGGRNIGGVRFSQYVKGEADFVKHWDFGHENILAVKALGGLAVPYGNSKSIPFVRSFFAGGANDNRGWRPYDLGPGSSGGPNEFNEANMKLSFSAEYRFNLFDKLNSAVFVDVGNIWNTLDNVEDRRSRFSSLSDLKELAVGSGFGLRYDFDFLVLRVDLGFKAYNPAYNKQKWFQNFNFAHSVLNVGINYPF